MTALNPTDIYLIGECRTPIGSMNGSFASLSATELGGFAIKGSLKKAKIDPKNVDEVYMGNVLSAGLGQHPARQAALNGGIPVSCPATLINKVCASGMKAIMSGANSIKVGDADITMCGGMESMTNVPHYLYIRQPTRFGNCVAEDGMMKDGLTCAVGQQIMGEIAELCATRYEISREDQDTVAHQSYTRAVKAQKAGNLGNEITPITITEKGKEINVDEDDELKRADKRISTLSTQRPAFQKIDGTVTAANASKVSDGAAAVLCISGQKANELNVTPSFRLVSGADVGQQPDQFPTTTSAAIAKAIKKAGLQKSDIEFFEINEAFSVVSEVNMQILELHSECVNVFGGAIALGHPIGCSGARIVVTLCNVLAVHGARYGCAGVCNGGGGGSAVVVENLNYTKKPDS